MTRQIDEIIEAMGLERLRKTPNGYKACCAINENHVDNQPSMHISFKKGMVKCFSCGAYKPLFDFLTDNGATFDEAVEYLFTDWEYKPTETHELTEFILGRKIPKSMIDRGFTIETLLNFKVGYDEIEEHITIPLYYKGKLYGIQYRKYPKQLWATEGFNKDQYIYNYEPTKRRIYVEGFTDTWMVHQNGTKEVSSALSALPGEGQLRLMSEHKEIWLAFDNDFAGFKGAFRVHHELGRQLDIKIISYKAEDPGACGMAEWQRAIANPKTFSEFEVAMITHNREMYNRIVKEVRNEVNSN